MQRLKRLICLSLLPFLAQAQKKTLPYYLPDIQYDKSIRNQIKTALSTREAAIELKTELLQFQQEFYQYAAPLACDKKNALLSGYIKTKNLKQLEGAAAIIVSEIGRGKSISITNNPNFRAFWFGTNKLFLNAIFFGHTISSAATENNPPKTMTKKNE